MYLIPIPALTDNYLGSLHDGKRALIADPGDAGPLRCALKQHALQLKSILVTHHPADYTGDADVAPSAAGAAVFEGTPAQMHSASDQRPAQPALPTSVSRELLINPFIARQATIMATARRFDASAHDDATVFVATRQ
jgi:glyoxylase-like metal-dependent hydrolase (beta-lactamase superfamily II)